MRQSGQALKSPADPQSLVGKKVEVYFNLHTHLWSVREGGKVRFHAKRLELRDAVFVVGEKARRTMVEKRQRSVHAFVRGTLVNAGKHVRIPRGSQHVTYNPYRCKRFHLAQHKNEVIIPTIKMAKLVFFDHESRACRVVGAHAGIPARRET